MVQVVTGDIFASGAETLVHAVNCVGVMGKGLALDFKRRYPAMFQDYRSRCARGEVQLGEPYLYRQATPPHILNFPTKKHWPSPSRLDDIVTGVRNVGQRYEEWGITSLAVPALGCGLGQLDWDIAGLTLTELFSAFTIPVALYAPVAA